ncbi:hypothetical protein B0H14DRAFT_3509140 [Mycena olivaceomarginata]|nr:hypothetical protein B0H14DRAFT_3509140 [Mycena olivaceomarginata]
MSSPLQPYLSKCGEAVVHELHKTICATRYEDSVDQETFLVSSANTILRLRPQVLSFVLISDVGECVFTLRSMLHPFNAPLSTPCDAYVSIEDFAGEIMRKQQEILDRKLVQAEHAHAANVAAAHLKHQAVLAQVVRFNKRPSPEEDAVSIPSGDEDSVSPNLPTVPNTPAPSPIVTDLTNDPVFNQVCPAGLLSSLYNLPTHLARLSLDAIPSTPPRSPLSPSLSLPDLVPDFSLTRHRLPAKGSVLRSKRMKAHHKQNIAIPAPVV